MTSIESIRATATEIVNHCGTIELARHTQERYEMARAVIILLPVSEGAQVYSGDNRMRKLTERAVKELESL